ncbi:MAG: STAS domain-containing protein [Planctomycetota bacterium]
MEIISKINDATYLMELEGAIVGTHAAEFNRHVSSINFTRLGITDLIMDFSQASMIDSIGIEAINHAQERGLKVSILHPQELVKDMLKRAIITKGLLPCRMIVEKDGRFIWA